MLHVDTLIGEELRLIKKANWDSIAMPMLVPRRAGFRNQPLYQDRTDLDEETKVLCITSNYASVEWFNTMYKNTFINYFKKTVAENRVFSIDIFPVLRHGLKKKSWFIQQQKEMDEFSFNTEILNETCGEVNGAYFSWELFRKNQILKNAWYPLGLNGAKNARAKNRKKQSNEIRLIFVDFAWAGDNGKNINDKTVLGCMALTQKDEKMYRLIEYTTTYTGTQANEIPLKIKELFWDYKADYIIIDQRSGGEILYNQLTAPMEHPTRSKDEWNSHGFTICNETDLHMVSESKLNDLRLRTIDNEAIPCIIPIIGSKTFNSEMWIDLKSRLKNEEILLLIDELEFRTHFENQSEWFKLTSEDKMETIIPYTQNMLFIKEAVNLTQEWRDGQLKLSEPRTGTKDRVVAIAYANAIATKIENKLAKLSQQTDFDIDDWIFLSN